MRHAPVSPFTAPALPHSFAEELTSLRSLLLTRRISQHVTSVLCDRGADVEAVDTAEHGMGAERAGRASLVPEPEPEHEPEHDGPDGRRVWRSEARSEARPWR